MATSRISACDSDVARLPYCSSNDCNRSASDASESSMSAGASHPGKWRPDTKRCATGPREVNCSQRARRSEEHTSELQSLMRNSYAVFWLKKKQKNNATDEQ